LTGRTQAERRAATRAALVAAGRDLFGARGYDAVSSEEIVAAAGVTRGALYHHFDGKAGLFAAVHEQVEGEIVAGFDLSALADGDPLGALIAAAAQFLDLSLDRACSGSPFSTVPPCSDGNAGTRSSSGTASA